MKIRIISLVKKSEKELAGLEAEYIKRIQKHFKIEILELKRKDIKSLNTDEIFEGEYKLVMNHLKKDDYLVLLASEGKEFTSTGLAGFFKDKIGSGIKQITFLVGGPLGLSPKFNSMAKVKLSLSMLTFSHKLVRLILLEAIYRSVDILYGGRYHK